MPNVLEAAFHKHVRTQGLQRIEVREKFGQHTLALLDYQFTNKSNYLLPKDLTPVQATWGKTPLGTRAFYGYINHYETDNDRRDTISRTRMVCVGTSRVLNSSNPTTWTGMTRSGIAREIAKRYRLRSIVHAHPVALETWASGTGSDFQALNRLAYEAGFRTWVDGSTLYFLDPHKLLVSAQTDAKAFTSGDIRDSRVTGGVNAPRDNPARRRVLYGMDYRTSEIFVATGGDPRYPTETLSLPANTYTDAGLITNAVGTYDDAYYTLELTVSGSAGIHPGSLIRLPSSRVTTDQEGLWLVSETVHEVTQRDFVTRIVATRGEQGKPNLSGSTTLRGISERTGALVRDGVHWEAELQEHVNA